MLQIVDIYAHNQGCLKTASLAVSKVLNGGGTAASEISRLCDYNKPAMGILRGMLVAGFLCMHKNADLE